MSLSDNRWAQEKVGVGLAQSMHCFQNKSADRALMKQTMKQTQQCMSFTLMFPRLGKAFNYCKMIGWHGETIYSSMGISSCFTVWETTPVEFHHGETTSFSLLVVSCKKCSLLTWRSNKCAWHPSETPIETGLTDFSIAGPTFLPDVHCGVGGITTTAVFWVHLSTAYTPSVSK